MKLKSNVCCVEIESRYIYYYSIFVFSSHFDVFSNVAFSFKLLQRIASELYCRRLQLFAHICTLHNGLLCRRRRVLTRCTTHLSMSTALMMRRFSISSNTPQRIASTAFNSTTELNLFVAADKRRFAALVFADDATLGKVPIAERVVLNADRAEAANGGLTHVEVGVDEVRVEFQLASSPLFRRWARLFMDVERGVIDFDQQDQGWPEHGLVPKQVLNRTSWGAGATVIFARKHMQTYLTRASAAAAAAAAALDSSNSVFSSTMSNNLQQAGDVQERLQLRWTTFIAASIESKSIGDVEQSVASEWFDRLASLYNETHRAYHTLTHIDNMLSLVDAVGRQSVAIELATWFHDAIYDPTRSDNEERSADLFVEFAQRVGLSDALTTRVRRFILATAKHRLEGDLADDIDAQLFLDLDLSILAASDDAYDVYARGIRIEYAHVPEAAYLSGRPQVLRSLTSKDVFVSEIFHTDKYEHAAKANVAREVASLERGEFL